MPRGQAIPDAREALFEAADRILARQGPQGITSRALTDEAGVAKGVLHNHFHDLDDFLISYAVDRIAAAFAHTESLLAHVGKRQVAGNLTDAATDLFGSGALTVSALMSSPPGLFARVQETLTPAARASTDSNAPSPPTSTPRNSRAVFPTTPTAECWPSTSSPRSTTSSS